jgi:hypothetical protein
MRKNYPPKHKSWAPLELGAMRDLSTIAFFRAGALLRRNGPVPGILAARRLGAIMDKSGRRSVATIHQTNLN